MAGHCCCGWPRPWGESPCGLSGMYIMPGCMPPPSTSPASRASVKHGVCTLLLIPLLVAAGLEFASSPPKSHDTAAKLQMSPGMASNREYSSKASEACWPRRRLLSVQETAQANSLLACQEGHKAHCDAQSSLAALKDKGKME